MQRVSRLAQLQLELTRLPRTHSTTLHPLFPPAFRVSLQSYYPQQNPRLSPITYSHNLNPL